MNVEAAVCLRQVASSLLAVLRGARLGASLRHAQDGESPPRHLDTACDVPLRPHQRGFL
jgi:hypothetical protein